MNAYPSVRMIRAAGIVLCLMVHGHEHELGYFMLSELAAVRGLLGLKIERDLHFGGQTLADVQ